MEDILATIGSALVVFCALVYVNGFRETFRAIRSIRIPSIRLRIPDAFKRDAQSFARLQLRPNEYQRAIADYVKKNHPMDRTFNRACDW